MSVALIDFEWDARAGMEPSSFFFFVGLKHWRVERHGAKGGAAVAEVTVDTSVREKPV